MTGPALDAADEALLAALARDGRAGVETLVRTTGLSRSAVRHRTQRLLAEVVDVVGIVHPAVFGLTEYAHLRITPSGSAAAASAVVAALDAVPFVSITSGDVPVVAEVRARTRAELATTVSRIAADPTVSAVETSVYLDILADAAAPARGRVPAATAPLDAVDRRLLAALQRDGRLSYAALADQVGLSLGATRSRVLRLIDEAVLHIGVRPRPAGTGLVQAGVALGSIDPSSGLTTRLATLPGVSYLATALGRWPLLATVQAESLGALADLLDRVRELPGAGPVVSWTHLRRVKERYQDDLAD